MKNFFKHTLGDIPGGRVLDVATQEGGFIRILTENLKSYSKIVGIDTNVQALKTATNNFEGEKIHFIQMNAEWIGFENECFDLVCISASLHHLDNIPSVLAEMIRVLQVGGRFVIIEMHSDSQIETQLTSVQLHHWIANVDKAIGRLHNQTLPRQVFMDYVESLGLSNVKFHDFDDLDSGPLDEEGINYLEDVIDRYIQRAEGVSSYKELKKRGEALRIRLHEVGANREPVLLAIGEKS